MNGERVAQLGGKSHLHEVPQNPNRLSAREERLLGALTTALGVSGDPESSAKVLEHVLTSASIELRVLHSRLESLSRHAENPGLVDCSQMLSRVLARLELASELTDSEFVNELSVFLHGDGEAAA